MKRMRWVHFDDMMVDDGFDWYCYLPQICSQWGMLGVRAEADCVLLGVHSDPSHTSHRELHAWWGSEGRTFRYNNVTATEELDGLLCQLNKSNW